MSKRGRDSNEGASEPSRQLIWKIWCPCPENVAHSTVAGATSCTKRNALAAKGYSEQEVRDKIFNHLAASPYHFLPVKEAERWSNQAEVTCEEVGGGEDEDQGVVVRRSDAREGAPFQLSKAATLDLPEGTVELRTSELIMVLDSIKRCALSVREAERLCERAGTAFRAEATALDAAHMHLSMALARTRNPGGASSGSGGDRKRRRERRSDSEESIDDRDFQ